jgi:hypothetical protein
MKEIEDIRGFSKRKAKHVMRRRWQQLYFWKELATSQDHKSICRLKVYIMEIRFTPNPFFLVYKFISKLFYSKLINAKEE